MKRRYWIFICLAISLFWGIARGESRDRVISFGSDLSPEEQAAITKDFPIPPDIKLDQIKNVSVTNEEEWNLLRGLVPDTEIGTKAISSVYIEKLTGGDGISVQTKNLTFVTSHMLANSLVTAGITDAKIFADAPYLVSGTAALTGIYKAFEELTGKRLTPEAKRASAMELIETGNLGESVGKERAATLVERTKERVITEQPKTKGDMILIITRSAREQNLTLTNEEKNKLADVLVNIKSLNLSLTKIQNQLKGFSAPSKTVQPPAAPQSFISKLIAFFKSIFSQLFSFVGKMFQ